MIIIIFSCHSLAITEGPYLTSSVTVVNCVILALVDNCLMTAGHVLANCQVDYF